MKEEPKITVGIMEVPNEVKGVLEGKFYTESLGPLTGSFTVKIEGGRFRFSDHTHRTRELTSPIRLRPISKATFTLFSVPIGKGFHWERSVSSQFQGNLILMGTQGNTIIVINEVPIEDYLLSVIASEMNPSLPMEFLKAQSIVARSWILCFLERRDKSQTTSKKSERVTEQEVIRWYSQEGHKLYDVCAEDHCQRYQGLPRTDSQRIREALEETRGEVLFYQGEICDTRYSKACGGITENFETAWEDQPVPYLKSISDAPFPFPPLRTEEEARRWILSAPEAYCHLKDPTGLERILPELDHQTRDFFRWKVTYLQGELEEILREKSGYDFGELKEIIPLERGASGRIKKLKIVGSKFEQVVGKELEIRRWLSRSHLLSSAFTIQREAEQWIFYGAGWGHGVGLCQIGAAVMSLRGCSTEMILKHYFQGVEIKKIY